MYWLIGVMLLNSQLYITKIAEMPTHDLCIAAMREAEIVVQAENKQLVCIKDERGIMTFEEHKNAIPKQGLPELRGLDGIQRMRMVWAINSRQDVLR